MWKIVWKSARDTTCMNFYASPSSGDAYCNRELTFNFQCWAEFFVCRHVFLWGFRNPVCLYPLSSWCTVLDPMLVSVFLRDFIFKKTLFEKVQCVLVLDVLMPIPALYFSSPQHAGEHGPRGCHGRWGCQWCGCVGSGGPPALHHRHLQPRHRGGRWGKVVLIVVLLFTTI